MTKEIDAFGQAWYIVELQLPTGLYQKFVCQTKSDAKLYEGFSPYFVQKLFENTERLKQTDLYENRLSA